MLSFPAAARIAGTPSRKVNLAASSRRRPMNIAAEMVAPDRDTPGTRAAACAQPSTVASPADTERSPRCSGSHPLDHEEDQRDGGEVDRRHDRCPAASVRRGPMRARRRRRPASCRRRSDGCAAPARWPGGRTRREAPPPSPRGPAGNRRRRPRACRRGRPRRTPARTARRSIRRTRGPGSGGPNSRPAGTR